MLSSYQFIESQNQFCRYNNNDSLSNYEIEKQLGKGSFGAVYAARSLLDGQLYAIKRIVKKSKDPSHLAKISNEIRAGQLLQHENIAKFYRSFEDTTSHYLVFEYVPGVDLFTYIEQRNFRVFSERETRFIMQQIISALLYMHQQGVMHIDVKLDNIMIDTTTHSVKLIDFGLCQFMSPECGPVFQGACGSDHYFPAEMLERGPYGRYHGIKADVWCLGVVMHALLTSNFPFNIQDRNKRIVAGQKHPSLSCDYPMSASARDLLHGMLTNNPEERMSMEAIALDAWMHNSL